MANEYGWAPMPQNQTPQGGQMQYQPVMQQGYNGYPSPMPDRLEQMRQRSQQQMNYPAPAQQYQAMGNGQTQQMGQANRGLEPPNGWVGLNWVVSEAEAQMYPVAVGNTVVMLEVDREIAYIKSVSREGRPGFWAFHMVPVKPKQENEYVTREEYNKLLEENNRMLAMIQQLTERGKYEQNTNDTGRQSNEQSYAAENHAVRTGVSGEPERSGDASYKFGEDHTGTD